MALKDTIPVAGVPMRNGSFLLEGYTPDFDATVTTKILEAGKLCYFPTMKNSDKTLPRRPKFGVLGRFCMSFLFIRVCS